MSERIEYIIEKNDNGKEIYIGRSVNYKVVAQANDLPDLEKKMKVMIDMWLEHGIETMSSNNPLEIKEVSKEEWESEYKQWMVTNKWMHIASDLYDTIRDLVGDKWTNTATENYEKNTTRTVVRDKLNG